MTKQYYNVYCANYIVSYLLFDHPGIEFHGLNTIFGSLAIRILSKATTCHWDT